MVEQGGIRAAARRLSVSAENPEPQLRMIKALLTRNGTGVDLDDVQRSEMEALHRAYVTPEHREAVAAFMEKRPARFR